MSKLARLTIPFLRFFLLCLLSLSLFFGGIIILIAKIPIWSLLFGLMIAPFGVIMLIFTIDEVARELIAPPPFRPVKCTGCGKITYAKEEKENVVCGVCREEEIDELLKEKG